MHTANGLVYGNFCPEFFVNELNKNVKLGISIKKQSISRSASWNLFAARQSHVIYWGIAAKLGPLSLRYHLPS